MQGCPQAPPVPAPVCAGAASGAVPDNTAMLHSQMASPPKPVAVLRVPAGMWAVYITGSRPGLSSFSPCRPLHGIGLIVANSTMSAHSFTSGDVCEVVFLPSFQLPSVICPHLVRLLKLPHLCMGSENHVDACVYDFRSLFRKRPNSSFV